MELSRGQRWMLQSLGTVSLGVGLIALVVPLVPTTPFVLVAAGCFARSSPRWHAWLMAHPSLGPLVQAWRTHRAMPRWAKPRALGMVVLTFAVSLLMIDQPWVQWLVGSISVGVFATVWFVPVVDEGAEAA